MIEANSENGQSKRGTAALVLACTSLILSLIACGVAGVAGLEAVDRGGSELSNALESKPEVASASQLEAVAHVILPAGTVLLSAVYSNGWETRLSAKFRLPRTELDAFLTSAKFTAPLIPGLRAVDASDNVGGGNLWDPETAKTFSGLDEEEPTSDGTRRALLLNLDAANAVTVYLYAGRG